MAWDETLRDLSNGVIVFDKDENIVEFIAAGGQGILVPRPWNREFKNSDISSKVVREHLEALC